MNLDDELQKASDLHQTLNSARRWALLTAGRIEQIADHADADDVEGVDADVDEVREAARRVRSVADRIEQGDRQFMFTENE